MRVFALLDMCISIEEAKSFGELFRIQNLLLMMAHGYSENDLQDFSVLIDRRFKELNVRYRTSENDGC